VGACRYLGDKLYEACRLCDELARAQREKADATPDPVVKAALFAEADAMLQRVADLPDPNDELLAYLPSRVAEGAESALSQSRAEAMCRRLVAVHCLYGVDKNPLAVELARLALWLESYAEGLPLTFLDHRLVCGDSLTGPFVAQLATMPGGAGPMDTALFGPLTERLLAGRMADALTEVSTLQAGVGKDLAEVERKRAAKERLDAALAPFRVLASVWSGGVMLGKEGSDDLGYGSLMALAVQSEADPMPAMEALLREREKLREMHRLGRDAVSYDLSFPEVFWPKGYVGERVGFDAVLGNPPWDKPHVEVRHFLANYTLEALDLNSSIETQKLLAELSSAKPEFLLAWGEYQQTQSGIRNIIAREIQQVEERTSVSVGAAHTDAYLGFLAKSWNWASAVGYVGMLLGGGFAKNPAAHSLRVQWIANASPRYCLHFDNKKLIFTDLPSIIEFSAIVTSRSATAGLNRVGLCLVSTDTLSEPEKLPTARTAKSNDGTLCTFSDLLSERTDRARSMWEMISIGCGDLIQEVYPSKSICLPVDSIDAVGNGDARHVRNELRCADLLPVIEGRAIRPFDGLPTSSHVRWDAKPLLILPLQSNSSSFDRSRYFRMAIRRKCGSPKTNARSLIAAVIPPNLTCSDSLLVESDPGHFYNRGRLAVAGALNSFSADALVRPNIQVMISRKLLEATNAPDLSQLAIGFIAACTLRLSCIDSSYAPLWRDQFGTEWRESSPRDTWPVLAGDDARWAVRAAIDAVVAQAYGLTRAQYAHVLGGFSHKSYPKAPALCLERFDELARDGMDAFVRRWDPYWDVPLVETLPKPVIELRVPAAGAGDAAETGTQLGLAGIAGGETGGRRVRKKKG
jgi:hypothetical protein